MKLSSQADTDAFNETGWTYIRYVVDTAREPFLILDRELRVVAANDVFYRVFSVKAEDTEQKLVYDLGNGQWDIPQLKNLLEDILPKSTFFNDFEVEHEFPVIGKKFMMVNARILIEKENVKPFIIMAIEDVTKQKQLEAQLEEYTKRLEVKILERTRELKVRVDELESMNKSMVDRELRMVDLKKEMGDMKKKELAKKK